MSSPNPATERRQQSSAPAELLMRLLEFETTELPVISLYLDGRTNEHGKPDFGPFVRKQLASRARTYAPHSEARQSFDEDFVRIERFLENEFQPSTQGLAISPAQARMISSRLSSSKFHSSEINSFFMIGRTFIRWRG